MSGPSPWVVRFAPLVRAGGTVLDLACGGGRHTRLFLERGHPVTAVDRDFARLPADLRHHPALDAVETDLEDGSPWPFAGRHFDGVVVTDYLHRPTLPSVIDAVAPGGGVLIYETFARGNEHLGPPHRPDFLLEPGELAAAVEAVGHFDVVAYEEVTETYPRPAVRQRICAVRTS